MFKFTLKYPFIIIAITILITLFFAFHLKDIVINNSITSLLPSDNPALIENSKMRKDFDYHDIILIGIENKDTCIINSSSLLKIQKIGQKIDSITLVSPEDSLELTDWLLKIKDEELAQQMNNILDEGISISDRGLLNNLILDSKIKYAEDHPLMLFLKKLKIHLTPVSNIVNITNIDNIVSSDFGLEVKPLFEDVDLNKKIPKSVIKEIFGNEMFSHGLISADSSGALILIELSFFYDNYLDESDLLFKRMENITKAFIGPENIIIAGIPMVNVYTSNYVSRDMQRLTPLVVLIVILALYLIFRNPMGVLVPISVVAIALIWTLGTMALLDKPITIIVSAMPVLVIAIGVADGIHLITEYIHIYKPGKNKSEAILLTMKQMYMPVIFTSLTTMAGFFSLATSKLQSIKDFGIFTAIGVFVAMLCSLVFIPALLKLGSPPKFREQKSKSIRLDFSRISNAVIKKHKIILWIGACIIIISVISIFNLKVGSNMVENFRESSKIYKASKLLNDKFGGTELFNIIIDTKTTDGIKNPEVMDKIDALQELLEQDSLVRYTISIADYIKRINFVMNNNDPAYKRIPKLKESIDGTDWVEENGKFIEVQTREEVDGRDLIAQYLLLYENSGGGDLENFVDYNYSKANISVQIRSDESLELKRIRNAAREFATKSFSDSTTTVTYTGNANLIVEADNLIIVGQIKSLGVALLVIFVLLIVIFRSVRFGILALLPILLTICLVFAIMSIFQIKLDYGTALIASIVLGIGVDYSIHFISRYRNLRKQNKDFQEAISGSFITSGQAIFFNSIAVAIGFVVLLISSFWPIIHLGWLVAANMLFSAILALLIIPALLQFKNDMK